MTEEINLDGRVKKLETKMKKYAIASSLAGLLLGGGGVFSVAQWAYKAPLDKQVMKYESAMNSLNGAIAAANESGAVENAQQLRIQLIALDESYRKSLGLLEDCMHILATSLASTNDGRTKTWLLNTAAKLEELQNDREPIQGTSGNSESST